MPFAHEEELQKTQQLVDEYTEKMKEERAAKEAKYANLASGKTVQLNEDTDEDMDVDVQESIGDYYTSEQDVYTPSAPLENETAIQYAQRIAKEMAEARGQEVYRKYQPMLANAKNDKERGYVMRAYLNEIGAADEKYEVTFTDDDIRDFCKHVMGMQNKEVIEDLIREIGGDKTAAVNLNGDFLIIKGNGVTDLESVRSLFVHKMQHKYNKKDVSLQSGIINNSTPDELAYFLRLINRGNDYYGSKYRNKGAEGFMHLADEFVAHAIQICYDTPIGGDVKANL